MEYQSATAEAGTSASGISTALDTGPNEHGTGIVAHAGTNAHLDLIAEINAEHRLATRCAQDAVQHAIRCGYLLIAQKKQLPHGEFSKWIATNCEFAYSTAARYVAAAKANLSGVEISTLSSVFPSGRRSTKKTISTAEKAVTRKAPATPPTTLMTGAPSIQAPAVSVELAVKALKAAVLAREIPRAPSCLAVLSNTRGRISKLRNDLARAELELAEAEKQVRVAYKELKAKEAQP